LILADCQKLLDIISRKVEEKMWTIFWKI
jgi:hypothetical protein